LGPWELEPGASLIDYRYVVRVKSLLGRAMWPDP